MGSLKVLFCLLLASSSAFASVMVTPLRRRAAAKNECDERFASCSLNAIGVHSAVVRCVNLKSGGMTPMISNDWPLMRMRRPTMSARAPNRRRHRPSLMITTS